MEGIRLCFLSLMFSMVILRKLVSLHSQYCQLMFVCFFVCDHVKGRNGIEMNWWKRREQVTQLEMFDLNDNACLLY